MTRDEQNPFNNLAGDLKERIQDQMPQEITAKRAALAILGLLIMMLGGSVIVLAVVVGIIATAAGEAGGGKVAGLVAAGVGICSAGYYVWQRAEKRQRRAPP